MYTWLFILKEATYKTRNKQKVLVILSLYRMFPPYGWNASFPVKDLKANIPDILYCLSSKGHRVYWSSFVYLEYFLSCKKLQKQLFQTYLTFYPQGGSERSVIILCMFGMFHFLSKLERKHSCAKLYYFL